VMSPPPPNPGFSDSGYASITISPFCAPPPTVPAPEAGGDKPEILNIALSFPGPIPPRNLKSGWDGGVCGEGREM